MHLAQVKKYKMSPQTIYIAISALREAGVTITATMFGLYLVHLGIPYYLIPITQAIFVTVIVLSEIPTGMLADTRGRGWSMRMGAGLFTLGMLVYASAQGFWSAILAESTIAIGFAFFSGAERAWITDAINNMIPDEREAEIVKKQTFARQGYFGSMAYLVAGFIGALLAISNYRLVWLAGAAMGAAGLLLAMWQVNGQGEPSEKIGELKALKDSLAKLKANKNLQWVFVISCVSKISVVFFPFWSIYFMDYVHGQLGLGIVWIPMYGANGLGAYLVGRWAKTRLMINHENHIISFSVLLMGLGLFYAGFVNNVWLGLTGIMILEFGFGILKPMTNAYIENRVGSSYRATFGSLESFVGRSSGLLVQLSAFSLAFGKPSDRQTVTHLWTHMGAALAILTILVWLFRPRKI
ncbi:MAG: MFS transporter [Patescibacteria group bacterium]